MQDVCTVNITVQIPCDLLWGMNNPGSAMELTKSGARGRKD